MKLQQQFCRLIKQNQLEVLGCYFFHFQLFKNH